MCVDLSKRTLLSPNMQWIIFSLQHLDGQKYLISTKHKLSNRATTIRGVLVEEIPYIR